MEDWSKREVTCSFCEAKCKAGDIGAHYHECAECGVLSVCDNCNKCQNCHKDKEDEE